MEPHADMNEASLTTMTEEESDQLDPSPQRDDGQKRSSPGRAIPPPPTNSNTEKTLHNTLKIHLLHGQTGYVSIWFTTHMTSDELSHCILHALLYSDPTQATTSPARRKFKSSSRNDSYEEDEDLQTSYPLSGLFRERDDLYVPLSQILRFPHLTVSDTFRTTREPPVVQPQTPPSHRAWPILKPVHVGILSVGLVVLYLAWTVDIETVGITIAIFIESLIAATLRIPVKILENCIDHPLKELYRYGPSVIGWEGLSYSQICYRITHMGDESFWRRNMDECMRIYHEKEKAALQIRKPIVYGTALYLLFLVVRSLIQAWAYNRRREVDPDMRETFEAFNMLMRQIRRGLKSTSRGRGGDHHDD